MKCSHCKSELIVKEQLRLESLIEHIECREASLKDAYSCSNKDCLLHQNNCVWDEEGEFYGGDNGFFYDLKDDKYSAIGSFAKKMEIEIYKKGLKSEIYLHPIFMLYFFKPYILINYKGNEEGEVLSKSYSLRILKKNSQHEYVIGANFCWHTWSFLWDQFKINIKNENYKDAFKKSYNRAWVYKSFEFFVKILYYKKYAQSKI